MFVAVVGGSAAVPTICEVHSVGVDPVSGADLPNTLVLGRMTARNRHSVAGAFRRPGGRQQSREAQDLTVDLGAGSTIPRAVALVGADWKLHNVAAFGGALARSTFMVRREGGSPHGRTDNYNNGNNMFAPLVGPLRLPAAPSITKAPTSGSVTAHARSARRSRTSAASSPSSRSAPAPRAARRCRSQGTRAPRSPSTSAGEQQRRRGRLELLRAPHEPTIQRRRRRDPSREVLTEQSLDPVVPFCVEETTTTGGSRSRA